LRDDPNQKCGGSKLSLENDHRLPPENYARKTASLMEQYFMKILAIPEANIMYLEDKEGTNTKIIQHLRIYFPGRREKDSLR